jgi:hypothetical protein
MVILFSRKCSDGHDRKLNHKNWRIVMDTQLIAKLNGYTQGRESVERVKYLVRSGAGALESSKRSLEPVPVAGERNAGVSVVSDEAAVDPSSAAGSTVFLGSYKDSSADKSVFASLLALFGLQRKNGSDKQMQLAKAASDKHMEQAAHQKNAGDASLKAAICSAVVAITLSIVTIVVAVKQPADELKNLKNAKGPKDLDQPNKGVFDKLKSMFSRGSKAGESPEPTADLSPQQTNQSAALRGGGGVDDTAQTPQRRLTNEDELEPGLEADNIGAPNAQSQAPGADNVGSRTPPAGEDDGGDALSLRVSDADEMGTDSVVDLNGSPKKEPGQEPDGGGGPHGDGSNVPTADAQSQYAKKAGMLAMAPMILSTLTQSGSGLAGAPGQAESQREQANASIKSADADLLSAHSGNADKIKSGSVQDGDSIVKTAAEVNQNDVDKSRAFVKV